MKRFTRTASLLNYETGVLQQKVKCPSTLSYKGEQVGEYVADLLVEGKVIIELKTVDSLQRVHEAQVINYLKATGIQVGLIVNFKHTKAEIKRVVLTPPQGGGDS